MLQQTQVKTVIPYWERWMRELPTIETLAAAPPEKIHKLWEGLGYYTRVRNMQKAAQSLVAHRHGKFPEQFDDVLALSGIGRYTAGAICSIAFNQPTPILDGNVIRVLTRVFGIMENPRDKTTNEHLWKLAGELVAIAESLPRNPEPSCSHLNQSLMELGALICTPRQPKCLICLIASDCVALQKNLTDKLPNMEKRAAATARQFVAFVVEKQGKFLACQRPEKIVNAHLWEFPNVEVDSSEFDPAKLATTLLGFKMSKPETLCEIKHSITRYRISLHAFQAKATTTHAQTTIGSWFSLGELKLLAFTSAHRKICQKLENRI